jgi:hypothetical protein
MRVSIAPTGYFTLPFSSIPRIFTQYTGTYIVQYVHS